MNYVLYESLDSGAELLSTVLSDSINILYEPNVLIESDSDILVKYPCGKAHNLCEVDCKVIYLRRPLDEHLANILSNINHMKYGVEFLEKRIKNNIHPKLIDFKKSIDEVGLTLDKKNKDPLIYHSFYWLNDYFWLNEIDKNNLLIINSNDVFNNEKKELKKICNFLNIKLKKIQHEFSINICELSKNNEFLKVNKLEKKIKKFELTHLKKEDSRNIVLIGILELFSDLLEKHKLT